MNTKKPIDDDCFNDRESLGVLKEKAEKLIEMFNKKEDVHNQSTICQSTDIELIPIIVDDDIEGN